MNTSTQAGHRCGARRSSAESALHEARKVICLPNSPYVIWENADLLHLQRLLLRSHRTPVFLSRGERRPARFSPPFPLIKGRSSARPTSKHPAHRDARLPSRTHFTLCLVWMRNVSHHLFGFVFLG